MAAGLTNWAEERSLPRDEVHFRARAARESGDELALLVVNISAGGLMARCDAPFAVGERIAVTLPLLGAVAAEVRWCLGGRAGLQFAPAVPLRDYLAVLAAVARG